MSISKKRVLVIAPHPDDAELGVGGTIHIHKTRGDHVTVMVLCTQDFKNLSDEPNKFKQGDHSLLEAHKARDVLGYDSLVTCNLADETLDHQIIDILREIEPVYYSYKPDYVYCTHYGDNNQDHRAAFEAAQVICRPHSPHSPEFFFTYETPSSSEQSPRLQHTAFLPNYYNILSTDNLQKKISAFKCYVSEVRESPHPRSIYGIESYARFRGLECNSEYAEAFQLIRRLHK